MQSDYKEIYKLTSERTGVPEETYKELGNFVFAHLYSHLRKPSSLIIKLKGVGSWYLRRKRMRIIVENFPPDYSKKPEDFESKVSLFKYENKKDIYEIFTQRLKDYDNYLEIRGQIREKRNESQELLKPPSREE